jgi:hypothetical protein
LSLSLYFLLLFLYFFPLARNCLPMFLLRYNVAS